RGRRLPPASRPWWTGARQGAPQAVAGLGPRRQRRATNGGTHNARQRVHAAVSRPRAAPRGASPRDTLLALEREARRTFRTRPLASARPLVARHGRPGVASHASKVRE